MTVLSEGSKPTYPKHGDELTQHSRFPNRLQLTELDIIAVSARRSRNETRISVAISFDHSLAKTKENHHNTYNHSSSLSLCLGCSKQRLQRRQMV